MDKIEKILEEIKNDKSMWRDRNGKDVNFSSKFLNTVGDIFEKYGYGTIKVYLFNQSGRDRTQADALLNVLGKFNECREITSNRAIGRYIIKTLDTLKKMEVK